jgi:phosphatidylglycerol---prolipoprotein diacylglyceryl transferase
MHPELFEIPLIHLTVKSYGLMMVIGFLLTVAVIRHLSRNITPDPQLITNAALYSLIGGVAGARLFYVVHYFNQFRDSPLSVFAIWKGGLELLGGVLLAIVIIAFYIRYHKLPMRRYLDILAIGLMLALVFGRIGCFLNGCCYGKPTDLPWAVRFPYDSFAYRSQINPNMARNRPQPRLQLPPEYFSYTDRDGLRFLKPYQDLTAEQKTEVTTGKYRCLPIHPTQLYESGGAAVLCLMFYLFWRRSRNAESSGNPNKFLAKSGQTFGLMFILYAITRFFIEFLRDDNPFEFGGLTISQIIAIAMLVFGVVLMAVFQGMKPDKLSAGRPK